MDLNHLQLFVEVADHKSFTSAAKTLGMQRSSVSRSISALERDLEVQLFQRTTRSVSLTTAGDALYAKVVGHLTSLHAAVEELPEREEDASGMVLVTVSPDLGSDILPRALSAFAMRYPRVHVDVKVTNRVVDLVGEGFDAAVRPGPIPLPDSTLRARLLTGVTGGYFASPNYLARAGTPRSLNDLAEHDWVGGPGRSQLAMQFHRPPILAADDMLFVRQALREGLGLGVLPTFLARDDVSDGRLVRLQLSTEFGGTGGIWLVMPPGEHVPRKVRVLRDFLVDWFRTRPLDATKTN